MRNGLPMVWRDTINDVKHSVSDLFRRWLPDNATALPHRDSWPGYFGTWSDWPVIEVKESDDDIHIRAELPGLSEKDFSVELDANRVILHGEKQYRDEKKQGDYIYSESRFGSFYRAIPLPCAVKSDKAQAKYRHGVLQVRLPKTEEAKAHRKRITVK